MQRRVARRKGRCPSTGKMMYRDEASANRAKNYTRKIRGDHGATRTYFHQECGSWHLTSASEIAGFRAELRESEKEDGNP